MASCGPWTKQCWTVWRLAPFCRASGSRPLDDRLTFGDQMANRVARFGGSWPLILVFVGVLGGLDRHERSGPAAAALRSLTLYPPQLDAVLCRHPAGANHHDEPAPVGNPEPPAGQNRISHQSEGRTGDSTAARKDRPSACPSMAAPGRYAADRRARKRNAPRGRHILGGSGRCGIPDQRIGRIR